MTTKTQFPILARVVAEMGMRQRYVLAMVLRESEQPVLHALAWEMEHANTVEAAVFAEREVELSAHRFAEADRAFAEAGIPDPPAATGGPVFIDVDQPPAA
jgi:hypothetical protein